MQRSLSLFCACRPGRDRAGVRIGIVKAADKPCDADLKGPAFSDSSRVLKAKPARAPIQVIWTILQQRWGFLDRPRMMV